MFLVTCDCMDFLTVLLSQVQQFLGQCAPHLDKGETYQGPAVIGIAMVAMGEELGIEMAIRSLEHLLQYSEQNIRRAVPLALGLLCISNPKVTRFVVPDFTQENRNLYLLANVLYIDYCVLL